MHTLRLLDTAIEIFRAGEFRVRRPNRDFLLEVRAGKYSLDEVLALADEQLATLDAVAERSGLPERVDERWALGVLAEMREELYEIGDS